MAEVSAPSPILRITDRGPAIFCPGCQRAHVFNAAATPTSRGASWTWNGNVDRPTFSPSMVIQIGRPKPGADQRTDDGWIMETVCHSFVRDGRMEFLSDSTHALAGQTVDLPPWPYTNWLD